MNAADLGYILGDGEEQNRLHPDTFWIPGEADRRSLVPGDLAKLLFRPRDPDEVIERMWVQVGSRLPDGGYVGTLANVPLGFYTHLGDSVQFEPRHVINIHRQGESW